jgi:tetratricopeptide (TPR) repeat protein
MKLKYTLAILMLFACLSIFGQQLKNVSMQGATQHATVQTATNQQESIKQLQTENEVLKTQLEKMEKEIELYRGDVRTKMSELETEQSRWTAWIGLIVAILTAGLGVCLPLFINNRNDKRLKENYEKMVGELKEKISSVESDANSAKESLSEVTELKKDIEAIKKDIDNSKKGAERAAKRAMVSKLFAQAVSEKDPAKAIELYSKIIEIAPNIAEAYNNRGNIRKDMNDQDGALQDYNKAIELDPNNAKVYNNRGNIRKDMNDLDGALQDYNKAIELDPNNAKAYNNRGNLRDDMKDQDSALQDYNKAIELDPNYAIAYNNRADLYLERNNLDKALADVNHSIDLGGGYVSFITKGEIYIAMEKYSDAIDLLTQALSYNAKGKDSFELRAKCFRQLAETEVDEDKKKELIAKAEADERKVELLKEENKA